MQDLPEIFRTQCPTPSEKWLLARILLCSAATAAEQLLALVTPDGGAAGLLVELAAEIEAEFPFLESSSNNDHASMGGGWCLPAPQTLHGMLLRTLTASIGDRCEQKASDLARMGLLQLPFWTARDMARQAESPALKEKVRSWFVSSAAERLSLMLEACSILSELQAVILPGAAPLTAAEMVAEAVAMGEVCRECINVSTSLLGSKVVVQRCAWPLLDPGPDFEPPHCEERFGCLLSGALEVQMRQLEIMRPKCRLHILWKLACVLLTWRFLARKEEETPADGKELDYEISKLPSLIAVLGPPVLFNKGCTPTEVAEAYFSEVVLPMLKEEKRSSMESAQREADAAMVDLLGADSGYPASSSSAKRKAKQKLKKATRNDGTAASSKSPAVAGMSKEVDILRTEPVIGLPRVNSNNNNHNNDNDNDNSRQNTNAVAKPLLPPATQNQAANAVENVNGELESLETAETSSVQT
ncbi:unnamed protein product, partial [Polarella glacialis]